MPSLTETDNQGKEKASSFEKALACAYIFVENERKKTKGFLFKEPEEEISFLVQILWPIALIEGPSKKYALFDAVGCMKRYFHDGDTSKSDTFSDQIQKCIPSLISRADFHKSLQRFASYFKDYDKKRSYEIIGCFQEPERARNVWNSLHIRGYSEFKEAICLPISIDFKKASESIVFLSELRRKAENDIKTFNEMLLPIDSILSKWHQQICDEIKQKRLPYDMKIKEITPGVESKIEQIEEKKRKELAPLEPEISRIESQLTQLKEFEETRNAEERRANDAEIDAAAGVDQVNEDIREAEEALEMERRRSCEDEEKDLRVSQLESRISHARSKLSRVEDRLERASETRRECMKATSETREKVWATERILREKRGEYADIEDKYDKQIAEEERKITDLEEKRDSIIDSLDQEAKSLTEKIGTVRTDISNLISRKQHLILEIDSNDTFFIQDLPHQGVETYAFIPFFVAMLSEKGVRSRFAVISPAKMRNDRSAAERFEGFILGKVPMLTERRNQMLLVFADILHELLEKNHKVGREILEKAGNVDLLNLAHSQEALLKGIDILWEEGVLNDRMTRKLKSTLPFKGGSGNSNRSQSLPPNTRCICPKCGTYINLDTDHCPVCGAKLPKRLKNRR